MNKHLWIYCAVSYTIGLIVGAGAVMVISHKVLLHSEAILK